MLATHSFHELNLNRLLPRAKAMGVERVELSDRHFSVFASEYGLEVYRREFAGAGITPISTFTGYFTGNAGANRHIFEVARAQGLEFIVAVPDPALLPGLEALAEEHGVKLALHNGYRNEPYGTIPKMRAALDAHPNLHAVLDVGYAAWSGADIPEAIQQLSDRLLAIHAKDLVDLTTPQDDMPYRPIGTGVFDYPAIMSALKAVDFTGYVTLEYQGKFFDVYAREAEISQSLDFLRRTITETFAEPA